MLHLIQNLSDKFVDLISQDPVRPHIPRTERVGTNKDIFVTRDENDNVQAITCVSYQENVPTAESELFEKCDEPHVAVFYTIYFRCSKTHQRESKNNKQICDIKSKD
jgi:uncharacterized protein YuzE